MAGPSQLERNSPPLNAIVRLLPTPMARTNSGTEVSGKSREGGRMLEESVKLLPTPTKADSGRASDTYQGGNPTLKGALKLLPTPAANDGKADLKWSSDAFGATLEESLLFGPRSARQSRDGSPSSDNRLSPWFVEWMMGAPEGWSDPDCPLSATEFRSRSATSPGATSSTSSESE